MSASNPSAFPNKSSTTTESIGSAHRLAFRLYYQDLAEDASVRPAADMGLAYNIYLDSHKIYGCKNCKTHLANHDDIISRNFRGQHGKAYLFDSVVNITSGEAGERNMTTGRHVVRDIFCKQCKETVGWKYDKAYETSEKYKEGKFILEAELLSQVT